MDSGIYKIWIGNKFYIGQSKNLTKRRDQHINSLRSGKHSNRYLQKAWNITGVFEFEVLEYVMPSKLDYREQRYLDIEVNNPYCMNISEGHKQGYKKEIRDLNQIQRENSMRAKPLRPSTKGSTFKQDLFDAQRYEQLTLKYLRSYSEQGASEGPSYEQGTHPPDIIIHTSEGDKSLDVKHDKLSSLTGNVFVEEKSLYCDYLCYYLDYDGTIMFVSVSSLKDWLDSKPLGVRWTSVAGDAKHYANRTHGGWIIPVELFRTRAYWIPSDEDENWKSDYRTLVFGLE
jgi:group I intron endonuclease